MSNENENIENIADQETPSELSLLKERATTMGITFHPNIGLDKLKAKIEEKQAPPIIDPSVDAAVEEIATINECAAAQAGDVFTPGVKETFEQHKAARRKKALRLVRIRVANMNPIKGNLKGEIISVGNAELGFIKKFVPFNAEQGWHVPQIMLNVMRDKKFMTHFEVKIGGKKIKKNKLVPEYAIEIMEPLTAKELNELKQRQIIASSGQ